MGAVCFQGVFGLGVRFGRRMNEVGPVFQKWCFRGEWISFGVLGQEPHETMVLAWLSRGMLAKIYPCRSTTPGGSVLLSFSNPFFAL